MSGIINVSAQQDDTLVFIDISNPFVSVGDTFTVNISCIPTQNIRAFEFKIRFDPNIIQAIVVNEGSIFEGYATFFNPGVIDNNAGTIADIYSLILGSGSTNEPGTFVNILFNTKDVSGTSFLDIYNCGVTDDLDYISVEISNGTIVVEDISGNPPPPNEDYPPQTPIAPIGPSLVESKVEYFYSVSTYDLDGDFIRFRFDWGDGNFSDWSEFVASNVSVDMSHFWKKASTYAVRVIAQDETGLNSDWSSSLYVEVMDVGFKRKFHGEDFYNTNDGEIFDSTKEYFVNQLIAFNISEFWDESEDVKNFYWDFGDGENVTESNPVYTYDRPGNYTVTLVFTDDDGNTYRKNVNIAVTDDNAESTSFSYFDNKKTNYVDDQDLRPIGIGGGIWILLVILAILGSLFGFFVDKF